MSQFIVTGKITPSISDADRLGLTLFFAVTIHAIVILGISFSGELFNPKDPIQTMEITLVQSRSDTLPDDPQYLAQANQKGSGNTEDVKRPQATRNEAIKTAHQTQGTAPEDSIPVPQQQKKREQKQREVMLANTAKTSITSQKQTPQDDSKKPNIRTLMSNALQIAAASAEVDEFRMVNKSKLKSKFITASTSESIYAAYQDSWRQKVERIGRINYPEEARKRKLSGKLTMTVAIKPNGTVKEISIDRSSGNKLLDDGARRIVRLASPYAPFPENIRRETDLLYITRTWVFQEGQGLYTK